MKINITCKSCHSIRPKEGSCGWLRLNENTYGLLEVNPLSGHSPETSDFCRAQCAIDYILSGGYLFLVDKDFLPEANEKDGPFIAARGDWGSLLDWTYPLYYETKEELLEILYKEAELNISSWYPQGEC